MLRLVYRASVVWLLLVVAECAHGAMRVLLVQPLLGDFKARQLSVFTGAATVLAIVALMIRWVNPVNAKQALAVGLFWTVLMISFEIALGRFVLDLSWQRILSDYDLRRGVLMYSASWRCLCRLSSQLARGGS